VPSIVNGLFSARSGIASHGAAIAVIGDNIANGSTIGFKSARAEFQDLLAGGQTSSKVIGSGSAISNVTGSFEQGTLEFTNRPLDLAIDGNGLFVLGKGDQRFFSRAGNFKVDSSGFITSANGLKVLGFPSGGSGALEEININTISQDNVATTTVSITGNLNAADTIQASAIPTVQAANGTPWSATSANPTQTTYADLSASAQYSTVVDVFDTLGAKHTVSFFFTHTGINTYNVRGYVNSDEVDTSGTFKGFPRLISQGVTNQLNLGFSGNGTLSSPTTANYTPTVSWNNQSSASNIAINFSNFTQFSTASNILSISQNGQGIGNVGSVNVEKNGDVFALLSNGQAAVIGTIGLVNFSNPEGLVRVGGNLLQQSPSSGEPVIGRPATGTFGVVQSGSLELSTVDIADQFVKLITLQRGFQANSRIITTINQLLNDIIQLA